MHNEDTLIVVFKPSSRKIETCILKTQFSGLLWHQYIFYGDETIINLPEWLSAIAGGKNDSCSFQLFPNVMKRKGLGHLLEQHWQITTKYKECDDSWYKFGFENCQDESLIHLNDNLSLWEKMAIDWSVGIYSIRYYPNETLNGIIIY